MPRITVSIDARVLRDLKRPARETGKASGTLASELLAQAVGRVKTGEAAALPRFVWTSKRMCARVDVANKEAVGAALDRTP
jgi:hypothetical protein